MRFKISYSNFDEATGVSIVRIETKIGTFVGTAHLQEDDHPYASKFAGCRIAEMKAIREYFKALTKKLKHEAKGMKQICDAIETSVLVTGNKELTPAIRIAKTNFNKKWREAKAAAAYVKKLTHSISDSIKERDKYIKEKYGAKENNI